jgi:CRISPR-associated endonuclease/helicase Cas3
VTEHADFNSAFSALCEGRSPFPWQCRLFRAMVQGCVPSSCSLPTGLGKSSIIPIWLIALAAGGKLPRRLLYIVNRRTVVDQASYEAARLLDRVRQPATPGDHEIIIGRLRDALAGITGDSSAVPLAVSTLRGELADNGEWKQNPARPAIIIGTVDMIGSKLLFSGYGDGRYGRAYHAGLIGQDALIVHDEAHLSPAFDALLTSVQDEQKRTREARPISVMRLSATTRAKTNGAESEAQHLTIDDDDCTDAFVSQRLNAKKALRFCDAEHGKAVDAVVSEAATLGEKPNRVLVYVRSPETAQKIVNGLQKQLGNGGDGWVQLLTGTIRGYERDKLADSDLFKAFKAGSDRSAPLPHTLYLVSTSAGEVGADWDADHLVCDLTTLDSMAQRFGRVNRLGGDGRSAEIVVVVEKAREDGEAKTAKKPNPLDAAIAKTGAMLRRIADNGGDVSPAALTKVIDRLSAAEKRTAFSPEPTILPATDILFDQWSLTSIAGRLPGRPEVGPYLHGVAEWQPPETYVAWRAEVSELASAGVPNEALEEIFDVFPLRAAEKLRDRSDRVFEALRAIADRLRNDSDLSEQDKDPTVILIRQNAVQWTTLSKVAPADFDKKRIPDSPLAYAPIVLPVNVGGLKGGMLVGSARPPDEPKSLDIAETQTTCQRERQRVWIKADDSEAPLIGDAAALGLASKLRIKLSDDEGDEVEDEQAAGSRITAIEYRVEKSEGGEPGQRVALKAHNKAVAANAKQMAKALALPDELIQAFRLAGEMHDQGKDRDLWQRYARNLPHGQNPGGAIAKSNRYGGWQMLGGYRHEFGSLLDAALADEIKNHPERNLILHLIAAHHGWGRPHFEQKAFDPKMGKTANDVALVEAVQRFGRLQQRFGRWGLAWLESILRCADALASSEIHTGGAA